MSFRFSYLLTMFAILVCCMSHSQNNIDDLIRLNKEYAKRSSLKMDIVYQGFASYHSKEPEDTQYGIVKKQGENIYNQIGQLESLHNEECNLIVDENAKMISIMKILSKADVPDLESVLDLIEKYMGKSKNIIQVKIDQTHKEYSIKIPGYSEYSEIRLVYDFKLWLVKKIILYYNQEESVVEGGKKEKPRLVITYKNIDTNPIFSKTEFKIERFVKRENDQYIGIGKYKGYKVISQI